MSEGELPPYSVVHQLREQIEELKGRINTLQGFVAEHTRMEFSKAHPRTGDLERVLHYLGWPESETKGLLALKDQEVNPPKSIVPPEAVV